MAKSPTPPDADLPRAEEDLMAVVEATDPHNPDLVPDPVTPQTPPPAEAPVAPPPPDARPAQGGALRPFLGMVLGGVVAAGAGFGLARALPDLLPLAPTADGQPADARLAEQAAEIAILRDQIAALSAAPAADPALADRLTALESREDPAPRLAALEDRLAALESAPLADGSPALATRLNALQAEIAALRTTGGQVPEDVLAAAEQAEARLKQAEARAAELMQQAKAASDQATRAAALDRIRAALDSGAPYAGALPALQGAEVPAVLADHAQTGLPTLPQLRASFPDAARAALESALRANMGESWTDRVSSFLRSQTGLRSLTPRDGDDPDAVLSRAEAALAQGRLADALAELDALPDAAKPALKDWAATATLRLSAESAVAALATQ